MPDTPDWSQLTAFTNNLEQLRTSITGNPLAGGGFVDIPASQYSSLVLVCNGGSVQYLQLDFHQASTVGGFGDTTQYIEYLTNIDTAVTPEWLVPMYGGSVRITNLSPNAINLIVYGSTRPAARTQLLGFSTLPRLFSVTGACTAGVVLPVPAGDGQAQSSQLHGQIFVRASSSSIGAFWGFQWTGQDGVTRVHYPGHFAAGQSSWQFIAHPSVPIKWVVLPDTTSATTTFGIELTQVGP